MNMSDEPKLKLATVTVLETITTHDIPTERVLGAALAANLKSVIVIGWCEDGEFYFASSEASGASCVWDMEVAKKKLLEISL